MISVVYLKMDNFKLYMFLCVTILNLVNAVPQDAFCCPEEQYITSGKNDSELCWDPKSNRTAPINLSCLKIYEISEEMFNFTMSDDGYLDIIIPNSFARYDPKSFCVGNTTLAKNASIMNVTRAVIICDNEKEPLVDSSVMAYCMIVSAVFLTLTALIYIMLPEVRDLQGKSIINFCISLALGLACLAIMNLISEYEDMNLCATRGFLTYFFFIAAFFWTNAISIQILYSMRRPSIVEYGWKEFAWYALYAWGTSALITTAMAIVNFHPGSHEKPGIGLNHCWFFSKRLQWYYMYSIMTILIVANIGIFIYTSIRLWRHNFASSQIKALKYKFLMTVRMFVIMGVPWIFEMFSSMSEASIIWVILDFVNVLQGPLIFLLLVVFRRRVIKAMSKRGMLDCISDRVEKYLAVGNDDEDNVIQHTTEVPMDDRVTVS